MVINIELIVVAIGGIIAFLTFLYGILKSPSNEKNNEELHNEMKRMKQEAETLKKMIDTNDDKTLRALEKLENRIEKITDLLIDHMRKD